MNPLGPRTYATLLLSVVFILWLLDSSQAMSAEEKVKAKEQVVEMFYHAYNSYMKYAYPADELMPLSCKGRFRGSEPSRGDIDDSLGNFTLTLIDTLDTLAVLGDVEGFEEAVQNIVRYTRFDSDVIVSVFETNIRVLGGLLGGHVMATFFKKRKLGLDWYNNELLTQAKEVGDRLLPAFNTSTGIPYPRINLKHGIVPQISSAHRDTCTACAGSMILEFAALSRLTGIAVYEEKARKAMDYLWQQRHRGSDLMGLTINVHSGDWVRRESGVGAGIDSYYEYVLKAYILLGDDNYLTRFNKHYDAVMRYVSQGPMLMDVHMHKPNAISRNFMDALLAFWPGLQVLKGDLVPAIETHEMLYQVMQRHNFIPEAFTTDFRVHWSHHPLRPEFIESTYFLYKATGDVYYLEAGKKVLENLELHARVPCGYAAIKNVKTGTLEDQMDSYVLAEMFKYLYLLFAERQDVLFDIDDFIFTTEAHLLPLALSIGNITAASVSAIPKIRREVYNKFQVDLAPPTSDYITTTITANPNAKSDAHELRDGEDADGAHEDHVCPNLHATHVDGRKYPHSVRSNIKNIVERASPQHRSRQPRLRAVEFIAGNKEQLDQLHVMGIRIATMADGRIQLLHTASEALSPDDAEDGMQFMQEMIELSKQQLPDAQHDPMFVKVKIPGLTTTLSLRAGPAQFGYDLRENPPISGMVAIARPFRSCREYDNAHEIRGHIVILERGDCMFVDKARNLQRIGAIGGIVFDHTAGSSSETQPLFAMSGDGVNDVDIPMVFLYRKEGDEILKLLADNSFLEVTLASSPENQVQQAACQQEETGTPAGPNSVQPLSGQTKEADPPALLQQSQPAEPLVRAGGGEADVSGESHDGFEKHMDDKFYHHEVQLRDLYYLQTGSRYMHVNLEVRPSPERPPPIDQRENTFSLDVLPDGSKMLTLRLTYQSQGYEQHKPQLNQLYMDAVHLLQLHSNFNDLAHTTDYLRALARFLEAAYFGISSVDNDALVLMRGLARDLEYVHRFPDVPEPPPIAWNPSGVEQGGGAATDVPQPVHNTEAFHQDRTSYAQAEDFAETPERVQAFQQNVQPAQMSSSIDAKFAIPTNNNFVKAVPPGEGDAAYGARVGDDGVLSLVVDRDDGVINPLAHTAVASEGESVRTDQSVHSETSHHSGSQRPGDQPNSDSTQEVSDGDTKVTSIGHLHLDSLPEGPLKDVGGQHGSVNREHVLNNRENVVSSRDQAHAGASQISGDESLGREHSQTNSQDRENANNPEREQLNTGENVNTVSTQRHSSDGSLEVNAQSTSGSESTPQGTGSAEVTAGQLAGSGDRGQGRAADEL